MTQWIHRTMQRAVDADIRLTDDERQLLAEERPHTRAECVDGPRPCPWLGCRYGVGLDVTERAGNVEEHPSGWGVCALDVAEKSTRSSKWDSYWV